jgi:hypothetical protein
MKMRRFGYAPKDSIDVLRREGRVAATIAKENTREGLFHLNLTTLKEAQDADICERDRVHPRRSFLRRIASRVAYLERQERFAKADAVPLCPRRARG